MADQNTISELWAIASGVGPVDVRLFVLLGEPRHISVSNDQPKLLITDIPIIGVTVQNLGTIPIEIGGSRSLQYGQGVRVPANSQWTPGGVSPIGASGTDTSVARPLYYDRNAATLVRSYEAGAVAPHGPTQRYLYSVPAGRLAYIEEIFANVQRDGAATAGGLADVFVRIAGSTICQVTIIDAAVGNTTRDRSIAGGTGLLRPGDTIDSLTRDLSTGGSVTYRSVSKITEFDL